MVCWTGFESELRVAQKNEFRPEMLLEPWNCKQYCAANFKVLGKALILEDECILRLRVNPMARQLLWPDESIPTRRNILDYCIALRRQCTS